MEIEIERIRRIQQQVQALGARLQSALRTIEVLEKENTRITRINYLLIATVALLLVGVLWF